MRLTSALVRRYRSVGHPTARSERVVAVGRAFLTVSALVAIYLDPTEPVRLREITYTVLTAYAIYSVMALLFVHGSARLAPKQGLALHALDIFWTSALTFVSEGPVSPFFLFFLFVVLAAAYRWGFTETIATAVLTVVIFLLETAIASVGPWNHTWFESIALELNSTILRVTYLLLTGFLLGYLAEQDKQSRAELAAIADVTRQPRVSLGLGGSVTAVARCLRSMFDAQSVALVLHDYETQRTLVWQIEQSPDAADVRPARRAELAPHQARTWLFPDTGRSWQAVFNGTAPSPVVRVTQAGVWPLIKSAWSVPPEFLALRRFRSVTAINLGLEREWQGRVYLFDVAPISSPERSLHFLEALADHVTPALSNVFLIRRLRARAGAAERAMVARELHDGAIQALFGIELKIEALRRQVERGQPTLEGDLGGLQELVRHEVHELRDLMHALRPVELDGGDLTEVLASVVERFRRDTGVSARFVSNGSRTTLKPTIALEIVRIVQEALVNVRKHSRAQNVLVRLTREDDRCSLSIEDDGCGFAFEGRLSAEELGRQRLGPAIIRERARVAGAALVVDSTPGQGTRVELTFAEVALG